MSLPREAHFDKLVQELSAIDLDHFREEPTAAIPRDTTTGIEVEFEDEDPDPDSDSMEVDARLFNCSVAVTARTRAKRAALMLEVERVFARLLGERFLREIPRPSFGRTGAGDGERPAFTATYAVAIPYRVALHDPEVER